MNKPSSPTPTKVDLSDPSNLEYWREHFGVTTQQLEEAVAAVGDEPPVVREHLLNQGGSAGPG
jgi:hypothetical protein